MKILIIVLGILALPVIILILIGIYSMIKNIIDWIYVKYMYYICGLERHKYYDLSGSSSFMGDFLCYLAGPKKIKWEPIRKKPKK